MQQLSIKMNEKQNYNSPYNDSIMFKSPDKQEKERQLGVSKCHAVGLFYVVLS